MHGWGRGKKVSNSECNVLRITQTLGCSPWTCHVEQRCSSHLLCVVCVALSPQLALRRTLIAADVGDDAMCISGLGNLTAATFSVRGCRGRAAQPLVVAGGHYRQGVQSRMLPFFAGENSTLLHLSNALR